MAGELMIDHRQGCGPDGKKGELWMLWSIACIHCQRTIAVLRRPGGEHVHLSNIDLGLAIPEAMRGAIPPGYVHPYMCRRSAGCAPWPWKRPAEIVLGLSKSTLRFPSAPESTVTPRRRWPT